MEPNEALEHMIGKTGLISVKYSMNPYDCFYEGGHNIKERIQRESLYTLERTVETLRQTLYKITEDEREYDFHSVGVNYWKDIRPPYTTWIVAQMSVGLVYPEDCQIGEYHLLKREYPIGGVAWTLLEANKFVYEGNFLWKREE